MSFESKEAGQILKLELPENLRNLSGEESRIEFESLTLIRGNPSWDKYLSAYQTAMDAVYLLTKDHVSRTDDELIIQYIGIRLFNTLAVSLRLFLTGYYQMSFAVQRDMIEIGFLLDYFKSFPHKIEEWKMTTNDERITSFRPKAIRGELDKRDGFAGKKREKRYKMFCEYAAHVSYPGNRLIAPNGLGEIGPFFNQKLFKACFDDLLFNGFQAVTMYIGHFKGIKTQRIIKGQIDFLKAQAEWYEEQFNRKMPMNFEKLDQLLDFLFQE